MHNPSSASTGNVVPLRRPAARSTGFDAPSEPQPPASEEATTSSAHDREAQRRQAWVRECRIIAISYVLNGIFIGLFALTDTVSWAAGASYGVPGVLACGIGAYLISSGWSARLKDAGLSPFHSLTSILLCLVGVALFPEVGFAYALMLFTVFITATYRSSRLEVQATLVVVVVLFGLLTEGLGRSLEIPNASATEQFLVWLFFAGTLGRCVMLSVINARNNRLLRDRGQQMAAKLAQIERLANHDELTSVLNRRRLLHILGEEMAHTDRSGTPVSVALLDLDHFKTINDTLGHLTGDQVLKRFAAAVQAQARTTDRFGRYGGEEFLLVLTGADLHQAELAVERTRQVIDQVDWESLAPGLRVTFSAGIATYSASESAEALLARADLGLYSAKDAGRNCTRAA